MSVISYLCNCFADQGGEGGSRQLSNIKKGSSLAAATSNLTKIFEELKCPICFNICVPPIHNCINGHIICNSCRQKGSVTTCPTCREALVGARNYFAENFVMNYAQQCRYASQGCEHLRLKGSNMKPHEDKCMFRPLKCIIASCRHEIPYKNFLAHLDFAHKVSGTDKLPTTVQFKYDPKQKADEKKCRWLPYYIQAFGNIYYVMMQRVRKNFWIWAYSQTSKESEDLEYNHFIYMKLKHPDKKIAQSWHGPVFPIRTPFKTIMSEGCCFTLSEMTMKNFSSHGMLNFIVDIRRSARTSMKDVKLSSDDSVTAVAASSLPTEYNRPPSFYEHDLPSDVDADMQPTFGENGNEFLPSSNLTKPEKLAPVQKSYRVRTAAIGILTNASEPVSQGATGDPLILPSHQMTLNNDDEDLPEKDFIDKIPTKNMSILNSTKSSVKLR